MCNDLINYCHLMNNDANYKSNAHLFANADKKYAIPSFP